LKWNTNTPKSAWGLILGALLTAVLGWVMLHARIASGIVRSSYDALFLAPYEKNAGLAIPELVLVYLDQESLDRLGRGPAGKFDRAQTHAKLVRRLEADQARAVVFDLPLIDHGESLEQDQLFAAALAQFGKAILAADALTMTDERSGLQAVQIITPLEPFAEAATALGRAAITSDDDLTVRLHPPRIPSALFPSLSWAAAELARFQPEQQQPALETPRWVKYYGPPGYLPAVSYFEAISIDPGIAPPPAFFQNKIVFIGTVPEAKIAGERQHGYRSPFSFRPLGASPFMPGVEVHATLFLNLIRKDWLNRLSKTAETVLVLLFGLTAGAVLANFRPLMAPLIALLFLAALAGAAYLLLSSCHLWFAWLILAAQIGFALAYSLTFNSIQGCVRNRLLEQSLARYLSPSLLQWHVKKPDLLKPGAEQREISILFSDIAEFTTISDELEPDQLAHLLSSYFETSVTHCIHPTEGAVLHFIRDSIFAIWNAPVARSDHLERACHAALLLRDQVTNFPGLKIRTRIGLHTGPARVGNFGTALRVDYSAMGENVELAARIQKLNHPLGTDLLVTGAVAEAVEDLFTIRYLGRFQLLDRAAATPVHELIGTQEDESFSRELRARFHRALRKFEERKFEAAAKKLERLLKTHPQDGPSRFYLQKIREFQRHPPPESWTGVIDLPSPF
jgi:adenylate cyclase